MWQSLNLTSLKSGFHCNCIVMYNFLTLKFYKTFKKTMFM